MISFFYADNIIVTALLLLTLAVGMKFWYKKHDVYFFVVGTVLGPIGEVVAIYFGAWQYTNPTFLGIPMWLPIVWGLAAVLIKRISELFVKIEVK